MNKLTDPHRLIWRKKPLTVMFIFVFLITGNFNGFAGDYVQNEKLSVKMQQATFDEIVSAIENQSDYVFFYKSSDVDRNIHYDVDLENRNIHEILDQLMENSSLTYRISGKYIFIDKKVDSNEKVNKENNVLQQKKQITGTVIDAQGEPIIGANIIEQGTNNGTVTDIDGNFSLLVEDNAVIRISYIGYIEQEINTANTTTFNITLQEDTQALDELVVVGYGVQRKSDVTGSISVSRGEDILKQQSFSALDGLKGKASGVNIFSNSGQPGGASRVVIRGTGTINASTDPLYIVDGVAMENFQYMNPNDIERIEVLKDASSAAIYGARGANGVILVTTKRGLRGTGVRVSYDGSVGVGTMASYMDVMNASEWIEAFMIGQENANKYQGKNYSLNKTDYFTDPNLFDANGNPLYDTDWQREATRTTLSHNHQLSIQQGNEFSSIGAFLNYSDYQGLMLNSYQKRVNAKLTYDADPTPWLSTSVSLFVNHTWGNEAEEDGGHQMPRRSMIEMVPWMPVKFPDGRWSNSTTVSDALGLEGMANPVHVLETQERTRERTQIFGNTELTFHLAPGLDLQTRLGITKYQNQYRNYSPTDLSNISYPNGNAWIEDQSTLFWQEETFLTYMNTFDKHRINGMLGLSWQERIYRWNRGETEGFSDDFYGNNNMGVGTLPKNPTSGYSKWAMNSYFLRGAYTYDDRYSATITGRMDGSSRFGANNKYAFFPSAGLAWVVSNEDFFSTSIVNNLKFHTSYGITGNSEIGTYESLAMMGSGNVFINDARQSAAWPGRLPNPDLKWEKTHQFDIGVDFGMFNNRLSVEVSYYNKQTKDLILPRPVPRTTGFGSVTDNMGQITNRGVDLLINSTNISTGDFTWGTILNLNYNKNRIDALGENNEDVFTGPSWVSGYQTIFRVGEPLAAFWGYERLGYWTEEDRAAGLIPSGQIVGQAKRSSEKKILGKGMPDFMGSFINNFSYKNFDLTVDFQFVYGVEVLQQFTHSTEDRFGLTNGEKSILYDAWRPGKTDAKTQAIRNGTRDGQSSELDSRWVADGSYLRANLIQLGYNFNPGTIKALSNLRIYAGVSNLFLIHASDFRGYDPEATSQSGTNAKFGQNMFFFQYPKPRTFTLGLSATF
ncbi:MAG: SusC/RagA family TonB-linked outer membrane protein [Proteiniphilum sp.]|uniref:SusC/RagA family TonB-linked outer membrane protein n=1 Tax=Proteiniphilum sp. TaxID=1926877 RepID=UPI002ABB29C2|nr:SusC/RagA family TonB-linked outer membrane protein [Proteiniphilum sp.]MDY9917684.1 SusC/RagA family TonB-linked outer membrane protein [Proteiniphilum sp.]